ncbi:hypothetical protein [Haloarcula marina]|uniref:hypothetical protein n=1 Tax=Haloarcula marina TaxID=2961574 RepID=UPI0020B8F65A|nr:hypothetical protein [Halomicroarcula marina]
MAQRSTTSTTTSDDAFETLAALDNRTEGPWVQCVCTEAAGDTDSDGVRFVFETFHGHRDVKRFDIPTTLDGTPLESFLDDIGYAATTAKMAEGDQFWMHADSGEVRATPPSWFERTIRSVRPPRADATRRPISSNALLWVLFAPLVGVFGWADFLLGSPMRRTEHATMGAGAMLLWALVALGIWFYVVG